MGPTSPMWRGIPSLTYSARGQVVGVHSTESSINALQYALRELWRREDVIHIVGAQM